MSSAGGYPAIAWIRGCTPNILIIRFRLYANTCKLISVLTRGKVFVRKWVEPIQDFKVPKTCSTVRRRIFIASGVLARRASIRSKTLSCSQRLIRRETLVVHCDLMGHFVQAEDQYLCSSRPFSTVLNRRITCCPAGQRYSSLSAS